MKDMEKCKLINQLKYRWMEISTKIDPIFQGNLNLQTMKLPSTKKQKFPLFNQTSCQQQQRNSSVWPCRFAAGKKIYFFLEIWHDNLNNSLIKRKDITLHLQKH